MRFMHSALVATAASLFASGATANELFEFRFQGQFVSGSAILEVRDDGHGSHVVLSGHGTEVVDGEIETITLVPSSGGGIDTSPAGAFSFDDRITGAPLGLTQYGLLFDTPTQEINISAVDGGYAYFKQDLYSETTYIAFAESAQAVPEPNMLSLVAMGLGGVFMSSVRRRRKCASDQVSAGCA